jgi:hypothetical protein
VAVVYRGGRGSQRPHRPRCQETNRVAAACHGGRGSQRGRRVHQRNRGRGGGGRHTVLPERSPPAAEDRNYWLPEGVAVEPPGGGRGSQLLLTRRVRRGYNDGRPTGAAEDRNMTCATIGVTGTTFSAFGADGRGSQLDQSRERPAGNLPGGRWSVATLRLAPPRPGLGDRGLRAAASSRWVVPACSRAWRSSIPVFLVASVGAQAATLACPAVESGNPCSAHGRRSCRATRQDHDCSRRRRGDAVRDEPANPNRRFGWLEWARRVAAVASASRICHRAAAAFPEVFSGCDWPSGSDS